MAFAQSGRQQMIPFIILYGCSDVDPNAISLKYSMYMLANTGDSPPPSQYISDAILK